MPATIERARVRSQIRSTLFDLAMQIELSLLEMAGARNKTVDAMLDDVFGLIRSGAARATVMERLQSVLEESKTQGRKAANRAEGDEAPFDLQRRIGLVIRRLRENLGLTQNELAETCNITQASVSQIERGKRINNLNTLVRISDALEISLARVIELANLEDFEGEVLLPEALESAADAEDGVPLAEVSRRLGVR